MRVLADRVIGRVRKRSTRTAICWCRLHTIYVSCRAAAQAAAREATNDETSAGYAYGPS